MANQSGKDGTTGGQHDTKASLPGHTNEDDDVPHVKATTTSDGTKDKLSEPDPESKLDTDGSSAKGSSDSQSKGKRKVTFQEEIPDAKSSAAEEVLRKLVGVSLGTKSQKDMDSYKFWQTQPVPRFDETATKPDGEIKKVIPEEVPKEPRALLEGFTWVTMDLEDPEEITEVYELLNGHYVEDEAAQFRLKYSASFFNWALKAPGWKKDWHVGVRATKSRKLIAFISAIPVQVRIRDETFTASEVNFLCIHKKLRSKRLAPILIEEITRRSHLVGVYQGLYTAGQVLPKPLSSCRYFHRAIDWSKLHDCGFAGLPSGSTKQRQLTRTFIPSTTSLSGFRAMQAKDIPAVHKLLTRYLSKFAFAPEFTEEEIRHWLFYDPKKSADDQMIWSYVVEHNNKITDLMTFYRLDSSIIGNPRHDRIKAAYLYYYASEAAFLKDDKLLKERLNALVLDTLVVAKKLSFDVCNALSLLDNPLFLGQQKFGPGDGQLHYYLYNYRAAAVPGGVDEKNNVDESKRGGVAVVML